MSEAVHDPGLALRPGEPGSGGYRTAWRARAVTSEVARHTEFQYANMDHQSVTAMAGMWLFLATEMLFFGGLFLLYVIYRSSHVAGVAAGSRESELVIGTINTVLLTTSSAVFSFGHGAIKLGGNRKLFWSCIVTLLLGVAFLGLKILEWSDDLDKHLFPGSHFAIQGAHADGAQLFWSFYWVATGLHGAHLIGGLVLVSWIAVRARRRHFSIGYNTPVAVVGLYWTFVDVVWVILYPLIYLVDRAGS